MSDERAWKTAVVVMRGQVDELRQLKADNARLRALVKEAEWSDGCICHHCGTNTYRDEQPGIHDADCPAFTPEGEVK